MPLRPADPPAPTYTFRLLGPFSFVRDGEPPGPLWPKPRALLALLLISGRPVSVERIAAELWPLQQPDSAVANVRSYVSALRRQLGTDAVRTGNRAYELCLPQARLDSELFLSLLGRSEHREDPLQRRSQLRGALDLWHGPALEGIPHGPMLESWAERMSGHRRRAVLELADVLLGLDQYADAQDLLRQHLVGSPTDETAYLLLISVLHQAGDSSAALAAYRRADRSLAELGLEPGPRLRAARQAVLSHESLPPG